MAGHLRFLLITLGIAITYVLLFAVQDYGFSQNSKVASLVFLPHGCRILSFFLFKYRSIPGLWIGHYATCAIFFPDFADHMVLYAFSTLPGVLTLPVVYFVLKAIGIDLLAPRKEYPVVPWTSLVLLAAIATLANGLLTQAVYAIGRGVAYNLELMFAYMIGDAIGALLFVSALIAFFRWQRQRAQRASSNALPTE